MTEGRPVFTTEALHVRRPAAGLRVELPPFELRAGEALALLGPSGAGKTTVLAALLGVGEGVTRAGACRFAGADQPAPGSAAHRAWLRTAVAFVPQDARAGLDPLVRLGEQVQAASGADAAHAASALEALGVAGAGDLLQRYPHEVSGGQAQRVLLAIALCRGAALVVADEPTASLDGASCRDLVAALATLRARTGAALLVATHDQAFVQAIGARAFTLDAGRVTPGLPPYPAWPSRPEPVADAPVVLAGHGLAVERGGARILDGVDVELRAGEILAVLGPSGAGKTTLALALADLASLVAGRVERPRGRGKVQYLFQDAAASLTPGHTVGALAREVAPDPAAVGPLAAALGLGADLLQRAGSALSGGERRRAALLRGLTLDPAVLILDEPTASLDAATAVEVMQTIVNLVATRRMACVLVTHDEGLAAAVAHRFLRLERGRTC